MSTITLYHSVEIERFRTDPEAVAEQIAVGGFEGSAENLDTVYLCDHPLESYWHKGEFHGVAVDLDAAQVEQYRSPIDEATYSDHVAVRVYEVPVEIVNTGWIRVVRSVEATAW